MTLIFIHRLRVIQLFLVGGFLMISKYFLESLLRSNVQGLNQKFTSPLIREAEVIEILDAVDRYCTRPLC